MTSSHGNNKRPRPGSSGWQPLVTGAIIYALVLSAVVAYRARSTSRDESTLDFRDFWLTAVHFRESGTFSTELGVHNYLPFFTIFMLPWSFLPLPIAAVLFTLMSVACLAAAVVMIESLLNHRLGGRPRVATLVALALMFIYVSDSGVLGQLGLLLLFLVVAVWFLAEHGREYEAGVALGLAALIKVFPAALIVFFVLKRRWRIAGAAVATALVLGVTLPVASVGWSETVAQHRAFREGAVIEHSARTTIMIEKPRKAKYSNNSLPIVLRRLLTATDAYPREDHPPMLVNAVELPRGAVWGIYLVLMAGIITGSCWAAVAPRTRWPADEVDELRSLRAQYAVWCCLMLLASPLVWTHYLAVLYWPVALLCDIAERGRRADQRSHPAALIPLAIWGIGVVSLAVPVARAVGVPLISIAAVWGGCVFWTRYAGPPRAARSTPRLRRYPDTEEARRPSLSDHGKGTLRAALAACCRCLRGYWNGNRYLDNGLDQTHVPNTGGQAASATRSLGRAYGAGQIASQCGAPSHLGVGD